jgi:CPA1 family monovalent cation:H+ antiporter
VFDEILISLAGIGLISWLCQWLAWWVKLPAILFLLLAGIAAGPMTGWLDPDALFGELLLPMVSLAVAVILFEGSLTLRLAEIGGLERVVRRLVTVGLLTTWVVTALATRWLLGLSWELAFLFGAVTVVTGPTVIVPMLRTVRPSAHLSSILRWEGIVIDPVGALLAVLVFEFVVSGRGTSAFGHTLLTFVTLLGAGVGLGVAAGYLFGVVLRRHWLPEYLHNVAALTLVFGVFTAADLVQAESGLLAVTVLGIWLANMRGVPVEDILDFKESLSVLLISGLFIILAARMDPGQLGTLGWGALGVLLAIQLVARPLKVAVATAGSSLDWRERALLAWIAPRGIVAAAVAALFALRLAEQGFPDAELLVPMTFLVIIGTVTLQSATARPLARLLGVAEPEPRGFLIVGAGPVARTIAEALRERGFRTLLADSNWESVRAARMRGLDTYYGNPVSEHADRHLDLVGLGRLLALSPRPDLNALATLRYRGEFGAHNLFTVAPPADKERRGGDRRLARGPGVVLFGADVTYAKLASLLSKGADIHATGLTEAFDYDEYLRTYAKRSLPLFAFDRRGRLHPFTASGGPDPQPGWTVMGLVRPDDPAVLETPGSG